MQDDSFSKILIDNITHTLLNVFCTFTGVKLEECRNGFKTYRLADQQYCITYKQNLELNKIDFLESPSADMIQYGIEKLNILGYLTCNYKITVLGLISNSLRKLALDDVRMILAGYQYGANILDLITMVAFKRSRKLFNSKYSLINPIKTKISDERTHLFYTRGVIGDEMIDKVFLFNDYMNTIASAVDKKKSYSIISQWYKDNKINKTKLIEVIGHRDEIIQMLLNIGLNPFYNGLGLKRGSYNLTKILQNNFHDGLAEIVKIKKCIYDGYRYNLLIYDESIRSYRHNYKNFLVDIPSPIVRPYREGLTRPRYVVAQDILLWKSSRVPRFEFMAKTISILDGYIVVDPNYMRY